MRKIRLIFIAAAVSIWLAASQTGLAQFYDKKPTNPDKPINVPKGREFTIYLDSNRTTGYEWQIDKPLDEKKVRFVKSRYLGSRKVTFVGAGGIEKWFFKAVSKGKTAVSFKYVRSWENDVPPIRRAVYNIIIE